MKAHGLLILLLFCIVVAVYSQPRPPPQCTRIHVQQKCERENQMDGQPCYWCVSDAQQICVSEENRPRLPDDFKCSRSGGDKTRTKKKGHNSIPPPLPPNATNPVTN
eukprot:TRINITY_DN5085_c0_g1_i1.p1 TRINITY_DN5085_c0_g1~~TRINITY_DN5085_c0_g1_i1.p1  ORF type:complete len:107 (-),score=14.98 TRINITY_DN5085_c0_g1_i1:100-420(-)